MSRSILRYLIIFPLIFAMSGVALAQPENVKQSLKDTKESLENLVVAKDENSPLNLGLRIETFKKVVQLAISEAMDLKIKLLALDNLKDEGVIVWKESAVAAINNAIAYYEEQKSYIKENESSTTLEKIKELALQFKLWREKNYLPIHDQIQLFLLLYKEGEALKIANQRWKKINKDLETLQQAGAIEADSKLWNLLAQARSFINESELQNSEAFSMFYKTYISPLIKTEASATSTAENSNQFSTSTIEGATSTSPAAEESTSNEIGENPSATTTPPAAKPEIPELSIKDRAKLSLQNIKEAYQVFIEMSSLVRELL